MSAQRRFLWAYRRQLSGGQRKCATAAGNRVWRELVLTNDTQRYIGVTAQSAHRAVLGIDAVQGGP